MVENWVAFNNPKNTAHINSGVVQVPIITGSEQAQPLVAPEQIIQKDGYIYIYVSNESAQKVFFDNLVIHHNRGPILQTDSYYPFGLTMAGISDQAAMMPENRQLFNDGSELQHEEFSDGTGLDWYNMPYRNYDPQIGMFHNIDPMPSDMISSYSYAIDNPLMFEDPNGGMTEADFRHIIDNLGNSTYGGTWSDEGGGSYDYFGSNLDGFYAGADQMNASGGWGTYGFAANYNAAAAAFHAQTGIYPLQGVSIVQGDQDSWDAARSTIYNEVQQSLDKISNRKQDGWYDIASMANYGIDLIGEGMHRLGQSGDIMKIGEAGSITTYGLGILIDLFGVHNYYEYGPNNPNSISWSKFKLNTSVSTAGIWDPPASILYFGVDLFYPGGWEGATNDWHNYAEQNPGIEMQYLIESSSLTH